MMVLLDDLKVVEDTVFRRSLFLALETICQRLWHSFKLCSMPADGIRRAFLLRIVQRIGSRVAEMQFKEHERWFGGVMSRRQASSSNCHQNIDKARLFSIITICLALFHGGEDDGFKELDGVLESLTVLYPSSDDLARDLLNSDDRFLATVSALVALRERFCNIFAHSVYVVLAAFRDIQFDAKVLLDWIDDDELGFETVLAIVESLIKDREVWESAADPDKSEPLPAKRQRLSSPNEEPPYRTMYIEETPGPSSDDVVVTVRVPFLEGTETNSEQTFRFSRKPMISTACRILLPKPSSSDFSALEEMMVDLKLMLNKRLLESEELNVNIERLRNALSMFLGEEGDSSDEGEEEEDVEC
ncbi:unnamed protein product [Haemonchus placei]|uniref:Activating signal cointegrator 1 complex subunit 2 n=1 Tax=Haemonchus placei TaxID=6290 RepID=A0A158QQL6_HAEPC|nr:unnamed protein product [Haemonchus placei]